MRSHAPEVDADTDDVADAFWTRSQDAVELTAVAETIVCRSALSNTL